MSEVKAESPAMGEGNMQRGRKGASLSHDSPVLVFFPRA